MLRAWKTALSMTNWRYPLLTLKLKLLNLNVIASRSLAKQSPCNLGDSLLDWRLLRSLKNARSQ
jgi:hypothetical protein